MLGVEVACGHLCGVRQKVSVAAPVGLTCELGSGDAADREQTPMVRRSG
jgi:hypothetical protein